MPATSATLTLSDVPTSALTGTIARTGLTEDELEIYDLPLESWKIHDTGAPLAAATGSPLVAGAGDDLAIIFGTFSSDGSHLCTNDQKANGGATSIRARRTYTLPAEYVAAGTMQFVASGNMNTTVSDATATVDVEIYKLTAAGAGTGSDLVTTSATSINSLTAADKTFAINSAGLAAGDKLDVRLTITINDAATGTSVIGRVNRTELKLDIQG